MDAFLAFSEFESLWGRLCPDSPFGRDEKEAQRSIHEAPLLARIWDQTEAAGGLLARLAPDPLRLSRLNHHLRRLSRFPEAGIALGEVELFEVKKFLHNYTELLGLLTPEIRTLFSLPTPPEGLLALLDQGRQSAESFHLADAYDPALAEVRARLRELGERLAGLQTRQLSRIEDALGLRFGERPFLVLPQGDLATAKEAHALLELEPYDEGRVLVKPRILGEAWALREELEGLLARERVEEARVLARLGAAVQEALPGLAACRRAVGTFDLALARTRLARELKLVRPTLTERPVRIRGGRFLPCEELCARLGLPYTPLDAEFDGPVTVIFGSNMGGKTVVLKTLAFLQSCVQAGLFVPALAFETRLYRQCRFIGEGGEPGAQGLSGFGREIRQVVEALGHREGGLLLLLDEFARTTSSREAEALLGALLGDLSKEPGLLALCSTHFRGLPRDPAVAYRRMAGLRQAALESMAESEDLETRIRRIDGLMDYRLVPDTGEQGLSDALAIAGMLGLSVEIVKKAQASLEHG